MSTTEAAAEIVDVVGVGYGPSNLALAAALLEAGAPDSGPLRAVFLESKPAFSWHGGMLLEGTTMQVSFLKDLVTMRNPMSRFSFVNYLNTHGRLPEFINNQTFYPERIEFSDYLAWVAAQVAGDVRYGHRVTGIRANPVDSPEFAAGARFTVTANDDVTLLARTVVVARGLTPSLPEWAIEGPRVFHNHRLLERLAAIPADATRFLVVGGGQSAAEVVHHLHDRYPAAVIEGAHSSYGFMPADDSPFANRVFDPAAVDDFFYAPEDVRAELIARHRTTNYSCVDKALLDLLNAIDYRERVTGHRRLVLRRATAVTSATDTATGVRVGLIDRLTNEASTGRYDAVVCATGFRSAGLDGIGDFGANLSVARDYQLVADGAEVTGLFVQGATEQTHGLGSTLLSNIAVRSGELAHSIAARHAHAPRIPVTSGQGG